MQSNVATVSKGKLQKNPVNINKSITFTALALIVFGFFLIGFIVSYKQALLYLIAGVLGLTLYHAHYGFTSSFRQFLTTGQGVGIRAQMILFLFSNVLFLPILLGAIGSGAVGYVSPVGISVIIGAFIFGIGMQLGDGCASGTLYHLGAGDARAILSLIGFVIGSVIGSAHFTWWIQTPNIGAISFIETFGAFFGLIINIAIMIVVFVLTIYIEKRRTGKIMSLRPGWPASWKAFINGPWSLLFGSLVLAIGGALVLLLAGRPWGVTSAFALWGAKISQAIGIPVTEWGYWQSEANLHALNSSIVTDITSVMNIGVFLGALLALGLSGKGSRYWRRIPLNTIVGMLIGGILMGYGARIAFGCNIGAYLGGIASFSLHGWVWMVFAMLGSIIGIKLRPACGLSK